MPERYHDQGCHLRAAIQVLVQYVIADRWFAIFSQPVNKLQMFPVFVSINALHTNFRSLASHDIPNQWYWSPTNPPGGQPIAMQDLLHSDLSPTDGPARRRSSRRWETMKWCPSLLVLYKKYIGCGVCYGVLGRKRPRLCPWICLACARVAPFHSSYCPLKVDPKSLFFNVPVACVHYVAACPHVPP